MVLSGNVEILFFVLPTLIYWRQIYQLTGPRVLAAGTQTSKGKVRAVYVEYAKAENLR